MNYNIEKAEKSTVKIHIELNANEWNDAVNEAYEKNKGKYSMPGWRKGHVPKKVLENAYGVGIFYDDAINRAFSSSYYDVLQKETDLEVVADPDVAIDELNENGVKMTATVAVKPDVQIAAYTGIKIKKVEYNVTDEDVNEAIETLRERNAREVEVTDRAAADGDITNIDYSGSVDGVKFDGGTAEKQRLVLGSHSFIPGFEEGVVGMKIGETKDVKVKFPDDYHAEELMGKEAVFTVKLNSIAVKELPEVNDEFIKDATGTESVDAYKAQVREKKEKENEIKAKRENENNLLKEIVKGAVMEIPDALVERQIDSMVQEMSYRMMYQGLKMEDYLKYTNQTAESYRETFREQAIDSLRNQLVIDKIIKDQKITASEDEMKAKYLDMCEKQGKKNPDFDKVKNSKQIGYIENEIIIDKLFDYLTANNEIK